MAKEKTLEDLFYDTLKDIYFAERQIVKALPKMARAATNPKLRAAFEKHKEQTDGHVERLQGCDETAIDAGETVIIQTPTAGGYGKVD